MRGILLLFLGLLAVSQGFTQAPTIDAGPDTITCPPDCIDLTATFVGGGNSTDYTVAAITYAPDAYAGTTVSLWDDGLSGSLPIGFDFCFYGNTYSNFNVCSNGWLGFSGGPTTWNPAAIPSGAGTVPKNCIMGPWQDLNPGLGGTIRYQTLGVAPFRRLVVTWDAVPYFSCTGNTGTQQIILYETTNEVENHIDQKYECMGWAGGRAVQGIHNSTGTEAVVYAGRNNTVWSSDNEAIRYTPEGDPEIEWYLGPLLLGTSADITLCPVATTTYTVKLISCGVEVATDDITIEVICCEPPDMTFTDVSCFGGCDGTATADGIGVPPFTYLWDDPLAQTTVTATGLCAGDYTVTVTDALGCVETETVTISEPEELTALVTATTAVSCFGEADGGGVIEAAGGTGTYTYDIGAGPVADGTFTGLAAGTYPITITDENGCEIIIDLIIPEPDLLEITATDIVNVSCFGGSDGSITVIGAGGVVDYEFSIDGGPFDPSGIFDGLGAGTYTIEILDFVGCSESTTIDITEPPALTLDLVTSTDALCFGGDDGTLQVVAAGGTGAFEYAIDGGPFGAADTFTGLEAGTHTVTVRDDNDCETDLDVVIGESDAIVVDDVVVAETCLGDCTGSIALDASEGIAPYTYSIDGCATTSLTGDFTDLCAGDYDICVVDANGCEVNYTLTVDPGETPADATIAPFGPLCINDDPVTMTAASPGGTFSGPGVTGSTFDPGAVGLGTYTITNTIVDGCGDFATYDITVNPLPVVSFTSDENTGCSPLDVTFYNTGDAGASCTWDFGDGSIATSCGDVGHLYDIAGEYDVSLTVTDANGCTNSQTLYDYISVFEVPNAAFRFGPQPATTIDTEINFTDMSTGASAWEWTFGNLGNSNFQDPVYLFPAEEGEYDVHLKVSNEYGCVDSTSQKVIISEQYLIYVPNTITPDGDAFNEVFKPYFNGIDIYKYTLTIYNRWGEIMFVSYDPSVGWNGTYGGEIVPAGVYIWHIATDEITSDKKIDTKGHVTVLY